METLAYIAEKYHLDFGRPSPFEIPDMDRDNLPDLFHELGFTVGVEIGVEEGMYSEILCKGIPNLHLYCVDPWTAYKGYRDHVSQSKLDRFYITAQERLTPYHCELIKDYSMDTVKRFENKSLDFVYIDGNHEIPWIIDDICAWRDKVRPGGIVSGHDFIESKVQHTRCHVLYAVHCAVRSYRIHPWFIVGTKAKTPGLARDKSRSWFWVQE
jgi:hypothetical protein